MITFQIQPPSQQCQHEMLTHRQMMMQHFQMSPEIIMTCAQVKYVLFNPFFSPILALVDEKMRLFILLSQIFF